MSGVKIQNGSVPVKGRKIDSKLKLKVQQTSLEEKNTNVAMLDRNERDRKPRSNGRYFNKQRAQQYSPTSTDTGLSGSPPYVNGINGSRTNLTNGYKPSYSPTSTDAESVSPLPSNGWDFSELEMRYTSMINSLKDELSFLEESNTNLLTELRESQNSNYVLTEEIRRQQRNNLSTLDELQACQTANSVLRQELQCLEQSSVKMSRDSEKYKKANSMLKDEIKDLKAHNYKRKNSMVTLKEKAIDLQNDILEKEKDFKDLSSLKQTVNIIVEAVENDSNIDNGYFPTDSDISSNDGNDDKQLGAFTPKPVKKSDTFSSSLPSPLARKLFSHQNGGRSPLLRRKQKDKYNTDLTERSRSRSLNVTSGESRDESPSPPHYNGPSSGPLPAAGDRRRGSLDSFHQNKDLKETSLRNNTLTRQLGKSLERLHDHKIKRSESGNRPRSMTFDDRHNDKMTDDFSYVVKGESIGTINSASPEQGTFEL
ncbi:uncharacterized protein [Clytia hemisphaerica]|uniref:Uncharacterized protein n=1 Tax=Clytia hemisphaerica TaxID=252671 RepID=A0A7M5VB46_9CNID